MKVCSLSDQAAQSEGHTSATREQLADRLEAERRTRFGDPTAAQHLHRQTLATYTAHRRQGCTFPRVEETDLTEEERQERQDHALMNRRGRDFTELRCEGRLILDAEYAEAGAMGRLRYVN